MFVARLLAVVEDAAAVDEHRTLNGFR